MERKNSLRLDLAIFFAISVILLPISTMAEPYSGGTAGFWSEIQRWIAEILSIFDLSEQNLDLPSPDYGPYPDPSG